MATASSRVESPVPARRQLDPFASPPRKRREVFDSLDGSTPAPKVNDEFNIPTCSTSCPSSGTCPSSAVSWTNNAASAKQSFQFMPATKDAYGDISSFMPVALPRACDAMFSESGAKAKPLQPATPAPVVHANPCLTVAPPAAPCAGRPGALMKALSGNRCDDVQEILGADPDIATEPFWDHDVEPPLCAAIRLKCRPEIVALLLKNGADVHSSNVHGDAPMDLLCKARPTGEWWERWSLCDWDSIKQMLIDAGAVLPMNDVMELSSSHHEPQGAEAMQWIVDFLAQDARLVDVPLGDSDKSMTDWIASLPSSAAPPIDVSQLLRSSAGYAN